MRLSGTVFAPLAALALAACGDGAAPPEATDLDGARGTVEAPSAGAAVMPSTPALSGGPAGQTPAYPAPAGQGTEVHSQPDAVGPSSGSRDPPMN